MFSLYIFRGLQLFVSARPVERALWPGHWTAPTVSTPLELGVTSQRNIFDQPSSRARTDDGDDGRGRAPVANWQPQLGQGPSLSHKFPGGGRRRGSGFRIETVPVS
jgi:hypothetical protein